MKYIMQVATPWIVVGESPPQGKVDTNRPKIADEYPFYEWEDVTGQPSEQIKPSPNTYIVELVVDEAVKDVILSDPEYNEFWYEPIEDGL